MLLIIHGRYITVSGPGFSTPGPLQFRPVSERGPKHFIAERVSGIDAETLGPGESRLNLI